MVDKLLRITGLGYASSAVSRLYRLVARLLKRQVHRTGQEISKDIQRLIIGAVLAGFGFIFAFLVLMLLHVGAGLLITMHLSTLSAVAILLGVDIVISLGLFLISFIMIRKPFLVNTRQEVVELYHLIMED